MGRMHNPNFVVLEGLDAAGTTTQTRLVTRALGAFETAEPSEGPIGRVLRTHIRNEISLDPVSATLAFTADRADHLHRVIRPALDSGDTVVCDRYILSTLAYQGASGVDMDWIMRMSECFEIPSVTIFLEVDEDTRLARLRRRATLDRYEDPSQAESLRKAYHCAIDLLRARGQKIVMVDGAPDKNAVRDEILSLLR